MREEFRFPRACSPALCSYFSRRSEVREVMINSGLALSSPGLPPRPTPCSAAPLLPGRLGRVRRGRLALLTVNSDSRPPWARLPPAAPYRPPGPGTPAPCCGSTASPSASQPQDEAFAESLFAPCTTSCGEEKYHCDEMSLKNRLHFPGGCWERH